MLPNLFVIGLLQRHNITQQVTTSLSTSKSIKAIQSSEEYKNVKQSYTWKNKYL